MIPKISLAEPVIGRAFNTVRVTPAEIQGNAMILSMFIFVP